MDDIAGLHPASAKANGVGIVTCLQHSSANVIGISSEESFEIVTINRRATIEPEIRTDRRLPSQIAELHCPNRYPVRKPTTSIDPTRYSRWNCPFYAPTHKSHKRSHYRQR